LRERFPHGTRFATLGKLLPRTEKGGWNHSKSANQEPVVAISTPIKPSQRRRAAAFGESMIVRVVAISRCEPGRWVCLVEPRADPVFIAEAEFGELLPESTDDSAVELPPGQNAQTVRKVTRGGY
jgi:hypothetical protein